MEDFKDAILAIAVLLSSMVSAATFIYAVRINCRLKKNETIKKLAKEVMAYHMEESIAIEKIYSLDQSQSKTAIKRELRESASSHQNNEGFKPTMTASEAKKYLK